MAALLTQANAVSANDVEQITATIFCDNTFKLWFNGRFITSDPLDFTPHNAVQVKWDVTEADKDVKVFALLCQDFATSSGFEYTNSTEHEPQLGDGNLIAFFESNKGKTWKTSSDWLTYKLNIGPINMISGDKHCNKDNLDKCVMQTNETPENWNQINFKPTREGNWERATNYTVEETGMGKPTTWVEGKGCGERSSPYTRELLAEPYLMTLKSECLNPRDVMLDSNQQPLATPIWTSNLQLHNQILFRYEEGFDVSAFPYVEKTESLKQNDKPPPQEDSNHQNAKLAAIEETGTTTATGGTKSIDINNAASTVFVRLGLSVMSV
eukprot:Pgem_evm1s12768